MVPDPRWYFPYSNESQFGLLWHHRRNKDSRGEEPPAAVKQQMQLYDQLKVSGDFKKQEQLMMQILDISPRTSSLPSASHCEPNGYGIVKNNFKNVPKVMPGSGSTRTRPDEP